MITLKLDSKMKEALQKVAEKVVSNVTKAGGQGSFRREK